MITCPTIRTMRQHTLRGTDTDQGQCTRFVRKGRDSAGEWHRVHGNRR
jgi:hypothetical protein